MKVKVCGITNQADYRLVTQWGADYAGFIFHPPSPRFIPFLGAASIIGTPRARNPLRVGVFVNCRLPIIMDAIHLVPLDVVQLHGEEPPDLARQIPVETWKAIRVLEKASIDAYRGYPCDRFLLEPHVQGRFGGTGLSLRQDLAAYGIETLDRPVILAGGIGAHSIRWIMKLPQLPSIVDINSTIEASPGKKCAHKTASFFKSINPIRGDLHDRYPDH